MVQLAPMLWIQKIHKRRNSVSKKTGEITYSAQIHVPKGLMEKLDWKFNDQIELEELDGKLQVGKIHDQKLNRIDYETLAYLRQIQVHTHLSALLIWFKSRNNISGSAKTLLSEVIERLKKKKHILVENGYVRVRTDGE